MSLPAIPPPCVERIPPALVALPQWVCWRLEARAGDPKPTKIPYTPQSGDKAKAGHPETWASFADAFSAYEASQGWARPYSGIGFQLHETDAFFAGDLDKCIDEATGEIADWAGAIVEEVDTYTEYSPSGLGLRFFGIGTLPPEGNRKGPVEMYDRGRFMTITGRRFGNAPAEIHDRSTILPALHARLFPPKPKTALKQPQNGTAKSALSLSDQDILTAASKAANGQKFDALWRGDTSAYGGDDSAADLALCSLLAFYCQGDEGRVERLFSQSGLGQREKWEREDYRRRTISAALAGKSEFYSPPGVELDKRAKRAASAATSPTRPPLDIPAAIPAPAGRTDKGLPEYAPYQIAEILGIETQAPDSDAALSFRAVQSFRADLCYCKSLGWLHWGGTYWEADDRDGSRTAALFVTLSRNVREEAALLFRLVSEALQQGRTEDGGALERAARAHLRHVKIVESEPFAQRAMILARSPLSVDAKLFEPRAWLIGFSNGIWDKGEWRAHQREDYLLNLCPVQIQSPEADVPPDGAGEWGMLLERITGGETDYARTLQEVAGYALSGASHLRILPWAYGGKGTGKSTFAELLTAVLGEGAASIDTKLLGSDAARERLGASLWGKRLVVCAEAGHQRIDPEMLKTLSGGDSYPVRFHYQEAFTARATHVLLMTANDPPSMNAYDDALRDRVLALPCKHRLEGDDPAHPDRLIFSEGARIEEVRRNPESALVREFAAWAVSGLARVFASQSLHKAARVQIATAQFWKDTDTLTPFWETVDEGELRKGMTRPELRRLYETWCLAEGVRKPIGPQLWTQACLSAGLQEARVGNARAWKLSGGWQFAYTSYTLSPISEQSPVRQKLTHEGLSENTPGSVRSVRGAAYSVAEDEDEELIV